MAAGRKAANERNAIMAERQAAKERIVIMTGIASHVIVRRKVAVRTAARLAAAKEAARTGKCGGGKCVLHQH